MKFLNLIKLLKLQSEPHSVIEITAPRASAPVEGKELREGLRTLQSNPFFRYMVERLRVQRFALEGRLKGTRFQKLEDIGFIQSGIFWTGWLDAELARLTEEPAKPSLSATDIEEAAFTEIDLLLQRVGVE